MIIIIIIIIIIREQFIKLCKWWFGTPHQGRFDIFNDYGQRVQLARPELPASHYIYMYRLLPTTPQSPSRHYYPWLIAGTNLPTSKGWIAWWAKADCMHITFAQGYYTIKSNGTGRKWTKVVRPKTNSIPVNQLTYGSYVLSYVKARKINLWTCWAIGESNPGPFQRAASGLTTGPPNPL